MWSEESFKAENLFIREEFLPSMNLTRNILLILNIRINNKNEKKKGGGEIFILNVIKCDTSIYEEHVKNELIIIIKIHSNKPISY